LKRIHAIITLIHAIFTLIHAIFTLIHAILTLIHKISGRGSTDCLGHCAMLACLFKNLASKPGLELDITLHGVLISSEENQVPVLEPF